MSCFTWLLLPVFDWPSLCLYIYHLDREVQINCQQLLNWPQLCLSFVSLLSDTICLSSRSCASGHDGCRDNSQTPEGTVKRREKTRFPQIWQSRVRANCDKTEARIRKISRRGVAGRLPERTDVFWCLSSKYCGDSGEYEKTVVSAFLENWLQILYGS